MRLIEKEKSEKAIKSFSYRVMRRLNAVGDAGRSFDVEDVQQELRIAWIKASESFSEEMGVPFQAYLMNGMKLHINRMIEKNIERRHTEVFAVSLDKPLGEGNDVKSTVGDIIADDRPAPDSSYEEDQHFEYATRKLKPRAKMFINLLHYQPEELMREVVLMRKKSDYAREELGINNPATNRLATWMVFDFMGASNDERTEIIKEVRSLGERVCEVMNR